MSSSATVQAPIRTTIPARLDRLRWSPFHTRTVAGPGAAWILDGSAHEAGAGVTTAPASVDEVRFRRQPAVRVAAGDLRRRSCPISG